MTQVVDRVSLPIRVHDALLGLAGRLDDDALTDARELLASAEVDRALELVAGCLVAGGIGLTRDEQRGLEELFGEAHCDASLISKLRVIGPSATPRHRFISGAHGMRGAESGVGEALLPVLEALPDVGAVWAVWRVTPAGSVPSAVPQRVVLVEMGTSGFAPASAYRVEHALRRGGIRATVEVLRDGVRRPDYHKDAMVHARSVSFDRAESADPFDSGRETYSWMNSEPALAEPEPEQRENRRYQPEPDLELAAPEAQAEPEVSVEATTPDLPPEPEPTQTPRFDFTPSNDSPSWQNMPKSTEPQSTMDDSALNDQEKDLLRQLQEELAKREQASSAPEVTGSWKSDRNATAEGHTGPHRTFDWPTSTATTQVNGIPPQTNQGPFPQR